MTTSGVSFQSHLDYYFPVFRYCEEENIQVPPQLIQIFYIARVIFSPSSSHRIKVQAAPLLGRDRIFSSRVLKSDTETVLKEKKPVDNFINLARMTSVSDMARLLPREHVIYDDNIFYRKAASRELIKVDYEGHAARSVSAEGFFRSGKDEFSRDQKVYLLFDNSTSMNGEKFKKLIVAKAIAIEYLRTVLREKPKISFRSFHSEISDRVVAGNFNDICALIHHIASLQTGGGHITKIQEAIQQAISDIKSDPEMKEAEILVMTDGFGAISEDLRGRLGNIKLHVILIPDLDVEKILTIYPDRKTWEQGGPDGKRAMPTFWKYYSRKQPPQDLRGDELHQDSILSYKTASRSVKDFKMLEILQGLNQIYTLEDVSGDALFLVVTSILADSFSLSSKELEDISSRIADMRQQDMDKMTGSEKMEFFKKVNFLIQFLDTAMQNIKEKAFRKKIKKMIMSLKQIQASLLDDPWIRAVLKVDNSSISVAMGLSGSLKADGTMGILKAAAMILKFVLKKLVLLFEKIKKGER